MIRRILVAATALAAALLLHTIADAAPKAAKDAKDLKIISVDVEDYFHVEAFSGVVSREQWEQYPSRVEANTRRLLDLFDECQVKGTFFILGWVADRYPGLVREIEYIPFAFIERR